MSTEYTVHGIVVFTYLLALIGVGAIKAGKIKSQADFSLAGRGLSTFVLVGTLLATWIGTGSIFGNAQKTFQTGTGAFILPLAGVCGICILYFLAARIRSLEQFTVQDILEARFGVATRILGTVCLILAYVIIVSYQYRAGAAVVGRLFPELQEGYAITAVAVFVIAYTALAGMFSVAYTDVANGILMILGICLALPILISKAGGFDGMIAALPTEHQGFTSQYSPSSLINWLLPPFLLMLGDANMYQRFFSAKSAASARKAAGWLIFGVAALEAAIILTALCGRSLVAHGEIQQPEDPGHIVVAIAFEALPAFLGAMLVATIVAIVVSTADSFLLAPATSLVRDVYKRFLKPEATERAVVVVGRGVVVVFGLIALLLAFQSDTFFEIALFAYTIYGASITPVLLAAFFWPRASKAGAVSGMAAGVVVALVWQAVQSALSRDLVDLGAANGFVGDVDAALPAIAISVVVLVTVSLLTKRADTVGAV